MHAFEAPPAAAQHAAHLRLVLVRELAARDALFCRQLQPPGDEADAPPQNDAPMHDLASELEHFQAHPIIRGILDSGRPVRDFASSVDEQLLKAELDSVQVRGAVPRARMRRAPLAAAATSSAPCHSTHGRACARQSTSARTHARAAQPHTHALRRTICPRAAAWWHFMTRQAALHVEGCAWCITLPSLLHARLVHLWWWGSGPPPPPQGRRLWPTGSLHWEAA